MILMISPAGTPQRHPVTSVPYREEVRHLQVRRGLQFTSVARPRERGGMPSVAARLKLPTCIGRYVESRMSLLSPRKPTLSLREDEDKP